MIRPVLWRALSTTTLSVTLLVGGPLAAGAGAAAVRTVDSSAVAEAAQPGERVTRSSVDLVVLQGRQAVHATNVAVAHSTCDGCRTVAASLQVVVVRGDGTPVDVEAGNAALALNEGCTGCESLADAHQLVVVTGPRTRLSPWVHVYVAMLRRSLAQTVASDLPLPELKTQIDTLAEHLRDTVQAGLTDRRAMWDKALADIGTKREPPPR